MLKHYYLDISLQTDAVEFTEAFFKQHILDCITALFGVATQAFNIDLLKFNRATTRAIIRVSADQYIKVRTGLTLALNYKGYPAQFLIHKAAPLLLALQGDSRNYLH